MLRYLWNASAGHLLGYVAENPPPTTEVDIDTVLKALQEVKFVDNVASLDVNDENENTCAEITSKHICQQRIGAVTLVHQHYGFIDKDLYFDFDIFPSHEFRVGDYVKYLAFRKSEQHTWKVQKIYYILNESWDKNDDEDENKNDAEVEEFTKVIPRQSHTRQIVTQVLDRKEREVICSDNIKFDLNSVASEFSPLVNDWIIVEGIVEVDEGVTDFSGELLHIESISALRSRILDGSVTQMDANGEGIIQNEVFFTKHCCETGYIPSVGDFVRVQAIESHQGRLLWRALTVVLLKAAHQGTQSHTSGQDKLTEDKRDELVQDKNGIVLSVNKVKFGNLQIGETKEIVIDVKNFGNSMQLLLRGCFHSKRADSQLTLLTPHCDDKFKIYTGQVIKYKFVCQARFIGYSSETFVFTFKGFKIGCQFDIEVRDKSLENVHTTQPPNCNKKDLIALQRNVQSSKSYQVIPGSRTIKPPNFVQVRLGLFPVPQRLWNLILSSDGVSKKLIDLEEDINDKLPHLNADLDIYNYTNRFHDLLYFEEIQGNIDMRKYDMDRVNFRFAGPRGEYLSLEVPGLAERRPSVLVGDAIHAEPLCDDNIKPCVYEGFVHKVLQKEIWVKFHSTFHSKYDMSDYRLTFQLSRTYLRRCHAAVNWAIQRLGQEMMFPNKVAPKTQQLIFKETDKDSTASKSFVQVNNVSELKLYTLEENKQLVWFNQRLNFYQKEAVRNILKGEARPLPYVIFGPPGTGKTITLVETIMQLLHLIPHSRLLVATPSNSASNLIAERLVDTGLFLPGQLVRLVSYNLMAKGLLPEKLIPYSTCADITSCDEKTPLEEEPLKLSSNAKTLGRHRVTIGTCSTLGLLHMMAFPHGHFTHVLVDEAGQATEPEILIPLTLINSKTGQVVLAGDPLQLGPVVTSFIAKKYGLGESYLSRLIHRFPYKRDPIGFPNTNGFDPRLVTKLVMNYRSVPEILNLSDSMFYDSELESQVSQTTGPEAELLMSLADILPNRSEDQGPPAIVFQGIRGRNLQEGNCPSWFNPQEVVQTIYYIKKLYAAGLSPDDIGIITPYQRQVQELHSVMSSLSELEALPKIGSVEEFQGQERRVIILSTVRSMVDYVKIDVRHALGFIASPKRLNVALTRAKALLIILGNPHVLGTDPYWRYVLSYIVAHGGYTGCNMPSQFECIDMDSDDSDQNNGLSENNC
uniref:RNA helicase n=1 Tax=Timema douglasi TaxID=61478 RepID=A0A7R8VAA4_TIMDO|nr:unnamed protein product [Timema douglasi]